MCVPATGEAFAVRTHSRGGISPQCSVYFKGEAGRWVAMGKGPFGISVLKPPSGLGSVGCSQFTELNTESGKGDMVFF